MNSNFEWQKHQANERVQKYQQEAAAHRLAKLGNGRPRGAGLLKLALLAGIFLAVWLIAGCRSVASTTIRPEVVNAAPVMPDLESVGWTMADRIYAQDKRELYLDWRAGVSGEPAATTPYTIADRIRFQDTREASLHGREDGQVRERP